MFATVGKNASHCMQHTNGHTQYYIFDLVSYFLSFMVTIKGLRNSCYLLKLHSLPNYENTKKLNYSQKVHNV
jgi:hypothetical protein